MSTPNPNDFTLQFVAKGDAPVQLLTTGQITTDSGNLASLFGMSQEEYDAASAQWDAMTGADEGSFDDFLKAQARKHGLLNEDVPTPGPAGSDPFQNRRGMLEEADKCVNGDRNRDYGDPINDFSRTAGMWGHYLGMALDPHDVAAMMCMLKLSRIRETPGKRDSWVDLAGYAACGYDCAVRENG